MVSSVGAEEALHGPEPTHDSVHGAERVEDDRLRVASEICSNGLESLAHLPPPTLPLLVDEILRQLVDDHIKGLQTPIRHCFKGLKPHSACTAASISAIIALILLGGQQVRQPAAPPARYAHSTEALLALTSSMTITTGTCMALTAIARLTVRPPHLLRVQTVANPNYPFPKHTVNTASVP